MIKNIVYKNLLKLKHKYRTSVVALIDPDCKNDDILEKLINNIILVQKSNSFYIKKSDFVLHNNATIRQLKARFNALRDKINE